MNDLVKFIIFNVVITTQCNYAQKMWFRRMNHHRLLNEIDVIFSRLYKKSKKIDFKYGFYNKRMLFKQTYIIIYM